MPTQTFNSPNIFITEKDDSFQSPSPTFPGACFIGLTSKGPAFTPTIVNDWNDFAVKFGRENPSYYMPYAVKGYLKYNSPATVIRVLGKTAPTSFEISGSSMGSPYTIVNSQSLMVPSSHSIVFGLINKAYNPADFGYDLTGDWKLLSPATTSDNFSVALTGSTGTIITYSGLTLDPTSNNYFKKVINSNPIGNPYSYIFGGFNWNYQTNVPIFITRSYINYSINGLPGKYDPSEGSLTKYSNARTPWINSQNYGSSSTSAVVFDLFKLHNLSDGDYSNTEFKISIANIQQSPNISSSRYGTFDVYVRDFGDNDQNPVFFEQHTNLTLDPLSENYIAKVIGNRRREWDTVDGHFSESGKFAQSSKYIRVELSDNIKNVPQDAIPYGFAAIPTPIGKCMLSASLITCFPPPLPTSSVSNIRGYYGIDFTYDITDGLKVINSHSIGSGSDSSLISGAVGMYYDHYDLGLETSCSIDNLTMKGKNSGHLTSSTFASWRKFTVPLYKGWDAIDWGNTAAYTLNSPTANISGGFLDAVSMIKNDEEVDCQDIFLPGVTSTTVLDQAITNVESRADTFLVLDTTQKTDSVATAQSNADRLDSSYACTYFPWIQIFDAFNNKYIYVPPSVMMAEVFAFSDKVADVWNAPAGLSRGKMTRAFDTYINLTNQDRNDLYTHGVNPIANFKNGDGITVWGQKTLQKRASKLDRINVRRLVIKVKRFVKQIAMRLIFEQAGPELWNQFTNEVTPFLEDIKNKKGLYDYQVIMDETMNPPEVEARRTLRGAIRLNPQVAAEFIDVGIIVTATGVEFTS